MTPIERRYVELAAKVLLRVSDVRTYVPQSLADEHEAAEARLSKARRDELRAAVEARASHLS